MGSFLALAMAIGIVFGARTLCDLIGAPLWFAKFLFICACLVITYFLADEIVPESKKPWGIWVAMLGAATGIIPVGFIVFKHIDDDGKARISGSWRERTSPEARGTRRGLAKPRIEEKP